MDELELEARLRSRLHARFGQAQVPPELAQNVRQAFTTAPRRVGFDLRTRGLGFGWSAIAAVAIVLVAVLAFGTFAGPLLPGNRPSPTPAPSVAADRQFMVLPPGGYEPDKANMSLASDVLNERLRALLSTYDMGTFSSGAGYAITFLVPMGGPTDESIRTVLRAPGELRFVPLDGTSGAVIGQNPPSDAPALFGWDDIASAAMDVDQQGRPVLSITLRPAAADAFGAYTSTHVGSTFAIVIDDDMALLPTVSEPITDGTIQVSGGGLPGSDEARSFAESSAIIVGGKLPDAWIIPTVPELLRPSEIESMMEFGFAHDPLSRASDVTVTSADLDAMLVGQRWTAIWRIKVDGLEAACPSPLPSDERGTCRWTDPTLTHLFDAETGDWLGPASE